MIDQKNQLIRKKTGINRDDFCSCLNAMHEAEKVLYNLQDSKWREYWKQLDWQLGPTQQMAHATARQRAEAFLRVFGLWRE